MTNSIAPVFLDLVDKEIKTVGMTADQHHSKTCSCTGKCRVCRCQQKKEQQKTT